MDSVLSTTVIANAKAALDSYVTATNVINSKVEGYITTLRQANYIGDASNGYQYFYTNAVQPILTTERDKWITTMKEILDFVETQLLKTTDPAIEQANMDSSTPAQN